MKNLRMKNLVVVFALLMSQVVAFANPGNPLKDRSQMFVKVGEQKAVVLRLINLENSATEIELTNRNGEIIFAKTIENQGLSIKLDLSRLEAGDYFLSVERELKTYTQTVSISRLGKVNLGEVVENANPVFSLNEEGFTVTNPSQDISSVSIFNPKGELLYKKIYNKKERKAGKLNFDMKQVEKGEYIVKVFTKSDTYLFDAIIE